MTLYMLNEIQRLIDAELDRLRSEWIKAGNKRDASQDEYEKAALDRLREQKQNDYMEFMNRVAKPFRDAQWKER